MMCSMNRKKHQRAVNRIVRGLNKSIENDELWRGRFICRQKEAYFVTYEDRSGSTLTVRLQFYDKKTGITANYFTHSDALTDFFGVGRLFWEMNDFIVNTCDAWGKEDPRQDKTDYREIKI